MNYYGVTRSGEELSHYGVKGMKWGVRKAIEKGDSKRLAKHYAKANKKLQVLKRKADVINNLDIRKLGPGISAAGLIPTSAGIGIPIMAKVTKHKLDVGNNLAAGFNTLAGAGMIGIGIHDVLTGSSRSKSKGHNKAVKKVNDWQKEMKTTFKGTKYEKQENNRPEFKDVYTLYEHGTLGEDGKGREIPYRAPTISVRGSDLVRDVNGKAKKIFKQRLIDPPQTQRMSDSKVWLGVQAPSGRTYSANRVNELVKVKKKHKSRRG